MKALPAILLLFLFGLGLQAQEPQWLWAKAAGGSPGTQLSQEGLGLAMDAEGNLYASGFFNTNFVSFDSDSLFTYGGQDAFIVKFDKDGKVLWANHMGGTGIDGAFQCATDGYNVYVVGEVSIGPCVFGGDTFLIAGNTGHKLFLAKFDSLGGLKWIQFDGGNGSSIGVSVCTDNQRNVYVAGGFVGSNMLLDSVLVMNEGQMDIFLAKYDTSGNVLWAKGIGGVGNENANSVVCDDLGNVYLAGSFESPLLTGLPQADANKGGTDAVVYKINSNGAVVWGRGLGGEDNDGANAVAVLGTDVYLGGAFKSPQLSFDTINVLNYDTLYHTQRAFLAKITANGTAAWIKYAQGMGSSENLGLAIDPRGYILVSGGQYGPETFDSVLLDPPAGHCLGTCDAMYILKYDGAGHVLCYDVKSSGGDDIAAMAINNTGEIFIAGDFLDSLFVLGTDTLHLAAMETFFWGKLVCEAPLADTRQVEQEPWPLLFPTIADKLLTISCTSSADVSIVNMAGEFMQGFRAEYGLINIDVSNYLPGMYLLQLQNGTSRLVSKFVVQH